MTYEINILYAIVVAFNFFLGSSILLDSPRKATNRSFFSLIITGVGWVVSLYYFYFFSDPDWVLVIGKVNFAFAALATYALYNFVRNFLDLPKSKTDIFFAVEMAIMVFITIATPWISQEEIVSGLDRITKFGSLYWLFLLHMAAYVLYTIWLLISNAYKKRAVDKKSQRGVKYLSIGISIPFFLTVLTNVILPYFFGYYALQDYAPAYSLFIFGFGAYAIGKHHLFNLKVISTEIFTFALWLVVYIKVLLSNGSLDLTINLSLLVLVVVVGMVLIRSVIREVETREKIELLAADLQKANDRLTELDRQKSEFVSFATHQLRAPLTAMKGYASLILEGDMGKITPETKEAVGRIFESTNTLTSIVDDYLNVTRIELGTMKYAFETLDLKTLIEDVIAELKPNIDKATNVKFLFGAENAGTDYRITADRDKLKQVIANLIDNSIKYTPSGSIGVSLSFNRSKHKFVFMLKDTGIGITPETLPLLFKKFTRAGNANKTNIKGTGLGLFVAKEIVTAHHATIRAESMGEGKGSTFVVEFEPFSKA